MNADGLHRCGLRPWLPRKGGQTESSCRHYVCGLDSPEPFTPPGGSVALSVAGPTRYADGGHRSDLSPRMSADIGEVLARVGLRRTASRPLILDIPRGRATHLSATSLHEPAASTYRSVDLATTYRNAAVMTERGALHKIEYAGKTLFGLAADPHHHLIRRGRGRLFELPASHFSEAAAVVKACSGFEVDPDGQVVSGSRRGCRHVARDIR